MVRFYHLLEPAHEISRLEVITLLEEPGCGKVFMRSRLEVITSRARMW